MNKLEETFPIGCHVKMNPAHIDSDWFDTVVRKVIAYDTEYDTSVVLDIPYTSHGGDHHSIGYRYIKLDEKWLRNHKLKQLGI